jgi:hypothetical protein
MANSDPQGTVRLLREISLRPDCGITFLEALLTSLATLSLFPINLFDTTGRVSSYLNPLNPPLVLLSSGRRVVLELDGKKKSQQTRPQRTAKKKKEMKMRD